jgi:hypothetical protein
MRILQHSDGIASIRSRGNDRERRPRHKPRLSGESGEQRDDLARTLDVFGQLAKQRVRPQAVRQRPFLSLLKHELNS